jgi:phage shock protein A
MQQKRKAQEAFPATTTQRKFMYYVAHSIHHGDTNTSLSSLERIRRCQSKGSRKSIIF